MIPPELLAGMLPPDVAAALGPERVRRGGELVSELVGRLGPLDMLIVMGELMMIQSLVSLDVGAAADRARQLAERYDAGELAGFLGELAGSGNG